MVTGDENRGLLESLPSVILQRSVTYLARELGVDAVPGQRALGLNDAPELSDSSVTALISLSGPAHFVVAYSFSRPLAEHIFVESVKGLVVAPEETEWMLKEAIGETLNIIAGQSIGDLAERGMTLSMSPPVVVSGGKYLSTNNEAHSLVFDFSNPVGELTALFTISEDGFDGVKVQE